MSNSNKPTSNLDPNLREKLINESKHPFMGLRRAIWITLFGSAGLGLLIMISRFVSGEVVPASDMGIQISAFIVLAFLLWKDRDIKN